MTINQLLKRTAYLTAVKQAGFVAVTGQTLTQAGLDRINEELSAIEAQLDEIAPEVQFRTLLNGDNRPVGFEVVYG